MKIIYIIDTLSNGAGMERVLTTKANFLADERESEVHVIVKRADHLPFFSLSNRVRLHNLNLESENEYRSKLENLLKKLQADQVISMYGPEFKFLYRIKDGSRKVVEFHFTRYYLTHLVRGIPTLRFRFLHYLKAFWIQFQESYYARKYDEVVLLTYRDKTLWGDRSNMRVQYNPLSFRSEQKSSLESKRVIAMGRLVSLKGFHLLIQAFEPIAREYPDWRLEIYGEGHDRAWFQSLIQVPNIQLMGETHEVDRVMMEASICVSASLYDGFGLTLTEAMECGVPCVAFDCECGPGEIIRNEEDGLLVSVGDVEGLRKAIRRLIEDTSLRKKMGERAAENVKRFYAENIL